MAGKDRYIPESANGQKVLRLSGNSLAGNGQLVRLLWNTEQLMGLETQSPLRVCETVAQSEPCVFLTPRTIHRLQKEIAKVEVLEPLRLSTILREDEFQFVSGMDNKLCSRLWAHANPIDP